jgi:uncharacterized membrane protein
MSVIQQMKQYGFKCFAYTLSVFFLLGGTYFVVHTVRLLAGNCDTVLLFTFWVEMWELLRRKFHRAWVEQLKGK